MSKRYEGEFPTHWQRAALLDLAVKVLSGVAVLLACLAALWAVAEATR